MGNQESNKNISGKKKSETKDEELNFFILFLSSSEEKNASDRGYTDEGAEERAVKETAMARSRITTQVIQQYWGSRGFKMQTLGGGNKSILMQIIY